MSVPTILTLWLAASVPAGIVLGKFFAGARHLNTRFTIPGETSAQGGLRPPATPSCVLPDHRFHEATNA